jgi:anti-sigma factor RsiW
MTPHATHDLDELSALLDDRLPEGRRRQLEGQLRSCGECQAALEAMRWARRQATRLAGQRDAPDLEGSLRDVLRREDARSAPRPGLARPRWLVAALLLLALIGYVALRHRAPSGRLPDGVASDFGAYRKGRLPLGLQTAEPAKLETYFASRGLGFPTRVFDLGMMDYALRGGREGTVAGRRTAFFVYRGPSGEDVICQMFRGRLAELPPPTARRMHDGIPFLIYQRDGLTLVFWAEGDVLCVLVGEGDAEIIVQLAFAKAMKGSGPQVSLDPVAAPPM